METKTKNLMHIKSFNESHQDDGNECVLFVKDILLEFDSLCRYKNFDPYSSVSGFGDGSVIYVTVGYRDPHGDLISKTKLPAEDVEVSNKIKPFLERIISYLKSNGYKYSFETGETYTIHTMGPWKYHSDTVFKLGYVYPYSNMELLFERD